MSNKIIFFLTLVLVFSCENSSIQGLVQIRFNQLKKYSLNEKHTSIILIKSFIVEGKCDTKRGQIYANVFLCKNFTNNDTILVFNICRKPFIFLEEGYNGERDLIIDSSTEVKKHPDLVFSNISKDLLTKGYGYIVADINKLEY